MEPQFKDVSAIDPLDRITIEGTDGLQIVKANSRYIEIMGPHLDFNFLAGTLAGALSLAGTPKVDTKKLITKNRGIVIQGDNACALPDMKWLIIHRLNCSEDHTMTLDEACNNEKGEIIWTLGDAPGVQTIRGYLSEAKTELSKHNIFVSLSYSEKTALFTLVVM